MYMVRMHTISSLSSCSALRSFVVNQTSSLCMLLSLAFMSDLHGVVVINMAMQFKKHVTKKEVSSSDCDLAKLLSVCRFLT